MKSKDRMQRFGTSGDNALLKKVLMTQKLHSRSDRKVPMFSKLASFSEDNRFGWT